MRLFVALDLPETVRQKFGELIATIEKECPDARWVRAEGIHVTLKFIGHIEDKNLDSICAALAPIRSEAPVEIVFRGLGFFPNERRPRVMFCGVEASPNLAGLAGDIDRGLEPLGIPRESRQFVPHLTLARLEPGKIPPGEAQKLVRAAQTLEGKSLGSARETDFFLFESILKHTGAEYKKLQAFPFVKGSE